MNILQLVNRNCWVEWFIFHMKTVSKVRYSIGTSEQSKQTVVCRAAQEASVPKAKVIFTDTSMYNCSWPETSWCSSWVCWRVCDSKGNNLDCWGICLAINRPNAAFYSWNDWSLVRTISNIDLLFHPLEDAIRLKLLPSITGHIACTTSERHFFFSSMLLWWTGWR